MKPIQPFVLTPFLALALLPAAPAHAQLPLHRLDGIQPGDEAGASILALDDIDGDGIGDFAVGYPGGDGFAGDEGVVRAFSGADGSQLWFAVGEDSGDRFGTALALYVDRDGDGIRELVVSSPGADDFNVQDEGNVRMLLGATGQFSGPPARGSQSGAEFGTSLATSGETVFVGIPGWDGSSFTFNEGRIAEVILEPNYSFVGPFFYGTQSGGRVGESLCMAGDLDQNGTDDLLVGAPGYDKPGFPFGLIDSGRVYALKVATGTQIATLDGPTSNAAFGRSLSGGHDLNGDGNADIVVGAPTTSTGGADAGAVLAYFVGPGFNQLWRLDGQAGDELGHSVAMLPDLDGDNRADVVAGAPGVDVNLAPGAGEAYLLNGQTGALISTVQGDEAGDRMGHTVGSAGLLNADAHPEPVVAAPFANPSGKHDAGSVQVLIGGAPLPVTYCTAKVNSVGCVPQISWSGVPSDTLGADDFRLGATNVIENNWGIMIWSYSQQASPFFGGTLCVAPPVKRTPVQASATVPSALPCDGVYDFHFSRAYRASKGVQPGDTIHFQYWSRDAGFNPPNSIGLTDAIQASIVP